jgi:hypothetical protein
MYVCMYVHRGLIAGCGHILLDLIPKPALSGVRSTIIRNVPIRLGEMPPIRD